MKNQVACHPNCISSSVREIAFIFIVLVFVPAGAETELSSSMWSSTCKARLGLDYENSRAASTQRTAGTSVSSGAKTDKVVAGVYQKTLAQFSKEYPPGSNFPKQIEASGGSEKIKNVYNQFSNSSQKFLASMKPASDLYPLISKCHFHAVASSLGDDKGAFAKQIETTKRFLLFRYLFSKNISDATGISRGLSSEAQTLQWEVSKMATEKIQIAESDIDTCPAVAWKQARAHFLDRPASTNANGCDQASRNQFNQLVGAHFDSLADALKADGFEKSPARDQIAPEVQGSVK